MTEKPSPPYRRALSVISIILDNEKDAGQKKTQQQVKHPNNFPSRVQPAQNVTLSDGKCSLFFLPASRRGGIKQNQQQQ